MSSISSQEEFFYLQVENLDFKNIIWKSSDSLKEGTKCDLCFKNESKFSTYQCCNWIGGGLGCGGGDIYVNYCEDCKNKNKRQKGNFDSALDEYFKYYKGSDTE